MVARDDWGGIAFPARQRCVQITAVRSRRFPGRLIRRRRLFSEILADVAIQRLRLAVVIVADKHPALVTHARFLERLRRDICILTQDR